MEGFGGGGPCKGSPCYIAMDDKRLFCSSHF